MRRLLPFVLLLLPVLAALAPGQDRSQLYSTPQLPPREVLDRLNLKQAWFTAFPMDGRQDGFLSVTVTDRELLVLTRSGVVGAIDLESGRVLWRTLPGRAYKANVGLAYNTFSVYTMSGTDLYSLNRRTGQPQWNYRLPGGLSAAPVADDEQIYLCSSNMRLYAMRVPKYDSTGRFVSTEVVNLTLGRGLASPETREYVAQDRDYRVDPTIPPQYQTPVAPQGPRPVLAWEAQTSQQLDLPPMVDMEMVVVSGNDPTTPRGPVGQLMGFTKFPQGGSPVEVFRFTLDAPLVASPGQYQNYAYVGGADANLYGLNMDTGRVEWRFIVGDVINRRPIATEKDVFVISKRNGMARVDRQSGTPGWKIPAGQQSLEFNNEVDQYLASNPKYVYAQDRAGRLLVLDRLQGKTLSRYGMPNWVYPISNEQNDRIFLAANNGMILCLHDKEYDKPFEHRKTVSEIEQVAEKLRKTITMPPTPRTPFRTVIRNFETAQDLKILISERAFITEDKGENLNRDVSLPAITNQPVGEVLNQILTQIDATSVIVRDTILVAPAGKKRN